MVLLGLDRAGKTTLIKSLQHTKKVLENLEKIYLQRKIKRLFLHPAMKFTTLR